MRQIDRARVPAHVAVIMDGNGRWAETRGLSRAQGHRAGAEAIRGVLGAAFEVGISHMTLYSFSTENWRRPQEEVDALMELFREMIEREIDELDERDVRVRVLGQVESLPGATREAFERAVERTKDNSAIQMILALNYGSRGEIADAAQHLAREVAAGERTTDEIDPAAVAAHLYAPDVPDPDLLIRSGGDVRVSNFLLWQIAYSEIVVVGKLWPDFGRADLFRAIREFQRRERRFGRVSANA